MDGMSLSKKILKESGYHLNKRSGSLVIFSFDPEIYQMLINV